MSSDDEDDYMSDKFASAKAPDVRPGLVFSAKRKREIEMSSKKANHQKVPKPNQREQLEKGLACAIPKSNIGFAMLAKMGYKEGTSLGKSGQSGIMEPIGITVKVDRKGLGREAAVQRLQERRQQIAREKLLKKSGTAEFDPNEFRMRMVRKSQQKQVEGDFARCQRACERLDLEMQFTEPTILWFWPEKRKAPGEEDEEEELEEEVEPEQYELHEKLELVNDYLRITHLYCHYCGVKYENYEDMETSCPGKTRDDH